MADQPIVLEMRDIVKQFGEFRANDQINLQVKRGQIHALLGENGAGKSTLMNQLSGLLQPTAGDILINGQKVIVDSPSKAAELGIGMVHQHFMLIDAFTVTENIILGSEPVNGLKLNTKAAAAEIKKLSEQYGLDVDPNALAGDISVGMQQRVEILKTLYRGADILIFDEPTAVLTPQEIDELMTILKGLAAEGKSVILITHKLDEIKAVADQVTVIRRGKSIDSFPVAGVSSQELADIMVGRSVSLFSTEKEPAHPTDTILSVSDLTVKDARGVEVVKNLSLDFRAGEVVGIAGIDGNGQSEFISALTGLMPSASGKVTLKGKNITNKKPRQITESGVGHIPEDRHRFGLELDMTLAENIALQTYYKAPMSKAGVLDYDKINAHARELIEKFDVRTVNELVPASALSGGNQQKAIIARELDRDADFVIAAQPTRGLDVGAIEYIHQQLINQRDAGKAVMLVSFELDEILNVADRIAVISHGEITGVVDANETSKNELGLLMAGMSLAEARAQLAGSRLVNKINSYGTGLVAGLAVFFGLMVGAIIMLVSGFNPVTGYVSLVQSALGSSLNIGEVLRSMTPLILTAAGFLVAQSAGFFNIGLAGQVWVGWIASTWFVLVNQSMTPWLSIPLAVIIGALAGALMGALPGWLRAQFGASEVITTIMLNYIALYGGNAFVQGLPKKLMTTTDMTVTLPTEDSLRWDLLANLTGGSRLNIGFIIAIVALVAIWFIMKRTTLGFEIRAVGLNPDAARYAGMSAKRTAVTAMTISGLLAGLAGATEGLGTYLNIFSQTGAPQVGYDGMAVALLASSSFLGIFFAALLFSILSVGGLGMPLASGVPTELVSVVTASIIFFIGANYLIRLILVKIDEDDAKQKAKKLAGPQKKGRKDKKVEKEAE